MLPRVLPALRLARLLREAQLRGERAHHAVLVAAAVAWVASWVARHVEVPWGSTSMRHTEAPAGM